MNNFLCGILRCFSEIPLGCSSPGGHVVGIICHPGLTEIPNSGFTDFCLNNFAFLDYKYDKEGAPDLFEPRTHENTD